jgi:hypothetical protein
MPPSPQLWSSRVPGWWAVSGFPPRDIDSSSSILHGSVQHSVISTLAVKAAVCTQVMCSASMTHHTGYSGLKAQHWQPHRRKAMLMYCSARFLCCALTVMLPVTVCLILGMCPVIVLCHAVLAIVQQCSAADLPAACDMVALQ